MAKQFVTFYVGDLFCGIDVGEVQEIIRYQEMTRVPRAPGVVRGLINLRGQVVAAFDLRDRFGLPEFLEDEAPMNVVVRTPEGPISFVVDRIDDVVEANDADFEMPPETLRAADRDLLRGVYKLERGLLLALDVDRIATVDGGARANSQV